MTDTTTGDTPGTTPGTTTGMMIISEGAFVPDNWQDDDAILQLNGDADPDNAVIVSASYNKVIIHFAGSHDGRGFSLARQLRDAGFTGHIRAQGALVPDQWRHLMKTGFDDLALSRDQLDKMPITAWDDTRRHILPDYQNRLMGGAS